MRVMRIGGKYLSAEEISLWNANLFQFPHLMNKSRINAIIIMIGIEERK